MKRSEMAQQIANLISGHDCNPEYEVDDYNLQMAYWILEKIQGLGMLPPFNEPFMDRSLGESKTDINNYKWTDEDYKETTLSELIDRSK